MIEDRYSPEHPKESRVPEARYAYYRRCQVFRRNGEQCKAPAEKGALICHAHAGQLAMAVRRERERRAVLTEAVAEMRKRGKPDCEMADLFTDFNGIQVTVAVMARAVINGRIDCKTAGQMVVHLQTCSKLLWLHHRGHRGTRREKALTTRVTKEHEGLSQICADERRSYSRAEKRPKTLPLINTDDTDRKTLPNPKPLPRINVDRADLNEECMCKSLVATFSGGRAPAIGDTQILPFELMRFGDQGRAHGPPELKAA